MITKKRRTLSGKILSFLLALVMTFGIFQYAIPSASAAAVSSFKLYATDKAGVDQLVGTWNYDSANKTFRDGNGVEAPFVKTFSGANELYYSGKDNYIAPRMAVCTKGILFSDLKTYVASATGIPINDKATAKWGMSNLGFSYPYSFLINRSYYPSYIMNKTFSDEGKVEAPAVLAITSYNQRNLAGTANSGWGSATTLTALNGGVEVPVATDAASLAHAFSIMTMGADNDRSLRLFLGQNENTPNDLNLGGLSLYNAGCAGFAPDYLNISTNVTNNDGSSATATITTDDGYAKAAAGESVSFTISGITSGYDVDSVAVNDGNGTMVNTSEASGVYTFIMPDSAAAINVSLKAAPAVAPGPEALNFAYFTPSGNPVAFKGATDSVVDANGNVYVSDFYNNRIVKFDASGNFLAAYGTQGSGAGQFLKPSGLATDGSGNIYVADTYNNRIVKFNDLDNNGSLDAGEWQSWGTAGSGALQFNKPMGVYVKGGIIYAADSYNHRLAVFDPSNPDATWQTIGAQGSENAQFKAPYDIAVDSQGNIWVSDTLNNRVQELDKDGNYIQQYASNMPYGISIDGSGAVFVAERQTGLIQCLTNSKSFGGKGTSAGLFTNPVGVNIDSQNRLWIVDVTTGKIQCSSI